MSWGTPASLGTANTSTAAHTLVLSAVTVAQGSLIVVTGGMSQTNGNAVIVTDSAGNTYTVVQRYRGASAVVGFIAFAIATTALSSGSITIAATTTGATNFNSAAFGAFSVTGGTAEDVAAETTGENTATTTPSLTSGAPANSGDIFFCTSYVGSTNANVYTEDGAWTNLINQLGSSVSQPHALSASYLVDAGSSAQTHAPTYGSVVNITQIIAAFSLAAAPAQPYDLQHSPSHQAQMAN